MYCWFLTGVGLAVLELNGVFDMSELSRENIVKCKYLIYCTSKQSQLKIEANVKIGKQTYSKVQTNWDTPILLTLYSPRKDQAATLISLVNTGQPKLFRLHFTV